MSAAGAATFNSSVTADGGLIADNITIDGTEYTAASKTVTYTGEKLHTVTASSKDYLDNTSADSTYSFLIDTTAPTVAVSVDSSTGTAVTVGSDEYYNTDTIVIKIDTSDSGSGLDDGTLTVNGTDTAFATVPTTTSYTTTLTSSEGIVEGKNTVKYTSKDIVGNEADAEIDFFVDTTAPTLTSVSIASNNTTNTLAMAGDVVTLTFTADETIQTPTVTFLSDGDAINYTSI